MARRETRSGSGLSFEAPAAGSAPLPHSCRTAAAQLSQQAPCPRSRSGMRIGSPPAHEHLALRLALHLAWAEGAQAPAPVPRQCMDAAHVSSPWRVPSCPRVRGTLSAVGVRSGWRGGKGGRCELRAISDLLLSHEQRPRPSVHAAQLPQRGLQLPKRHDQTATRGHEQVVSQPRPAAPPTAPRTHRSRLRSCGAPGLVACAIAAQQPYPSLSLSLSLSPSPSPGPNQSTLAGGMGRRRAASTPCRRSSGPAAPPH